MNIGAETIIKSIIMQSFRGAIDADVAVLRTVVQSGGSVFCTKLKIKTENSIIVIDMEFSSSELSIANSVKLSMLDGITSTLAALREAELLWPIQKHTAIGHSTVLFELRVEYIKPHIRATSEIEADIIKALDSAEDFLDSLEDYDDAGFYHYM